MKENYPNLAKIHELICHFIILFSTALTNSSTPQAKSSFLLGKTGGASWCHRSSNLCHIPFFFATVPSNNWHSTFKLVQTIFTSWLYCIVKDFLIQGEEGVRQKWLTENWKDKKKCISHANIATPTLHFRVATMDGAHFFMISLREEGVKYVKMIKKAQNLST